MDFNEYQKQAMRTASGAAKQNLVLNGIMGLCGEAGECIDVVKKHMFQGHELDTEKLIDEASDCLWYLAEIASGLEISLEDIAIHNVEKLKKRYPDGFDADKSVNRSG
jgi:NTP pyrophosphatase (non-canonical NTP hydrolase)